MTISKRAARLILPLLFSIVVAAPPASAQPAWFTRDFLAGYYADLARDMAPVRAYTDQILGSPVPDDFWAIMERHARASIVRPGYVDFAYPRILDLIAEDATPEDLLALDTIIQQLAATEGVLRLPQKKQEAFLHISEDMLRWTEANQPDACSLLVTAKELDLIAGAQLEYHYLLTAGLPYLERYLTIVYEALAAEVDDFPAAAVLADNAATRRDVNAYEEAFEAAVLASPRYTEMERYFADGERGNPSIICHFGLLTVEAVWALPVAVRTTVLLSVLGAAD